MSWMIGAVSAYGASPCPIERVHRHASLPVAARHVPLAQMGYATPCRSSTRSSGPVRPDRLQHDRIDVSVPEVAEPDDALLPRPEAAERSPDPALDRVHAMRTAGRSARFGPAAGPRCRCRGDIRALTPIQKRAADGVLFYPGRDRPAAVVVRVTPSHPAMVAGAQAACIPRSEVPASARVGSVSRRGFSLLVVSLIPLPAGRRTGARGHRDDARDRAVRDARGSGRRPVCRRACSPPRRGRRRASVLPRGTGAFTCRRAAPIGQRAPERGPGAHGRPRPVAVRTQPHAASRIRPSRSAPDPRAARGARLTPRNGRLTRRRLVRVQPALHPHGVRARRGRRHREIDHGDRRRPAHRHRLALRNERPASCPVVLAHEAFHLTAVPPTSRSCRGRRAGSVQQLLADPTIADERTELAQSTNAGVVIRLNTHEEAVLRSSPRAFRRCAERAPRGLERPYFAAFFDPLADPTPGNRYPRKRPPRLGSRPARPPRSTSTSKQSCSSTRIRARSPEAEFARVAGLPRPRCRPRPRDARPSPRNPRRTADALLGRSMCDAEPCSFRPRPSPSF